MQLTLRLFGAEVLHVDISDTDEPAADGADLSGGTVGSTPVGFRASDLDQRWAEHPTPDLE